MIYRDGIEKEGFAGNSHFLGIANLGYLEALSAILRPEFEYLDLF